MPVAVAPDRAKGIGAAREGIVRRNAAVVEDPVDFAERARKILGLVRPAPVTDREKQMARPVEEKPAPVVRRVKRRIVLLVRPENRLLLDPAVVLDPTADHHGHRRVRRGARLDVGQIHPAVFRVVRMHGDIEQTAVLFDVNLRQTADRPGIKFSLNDEAQPPDAFGHEQVAVRQKRKAPRRLEPGNDGFEAKRVALRRERELGGRRRERDAAGEILGAFAQHMGDQPVDFRFGQHPAKGGHAGLRPTVGNAASHVRRTAAVIPKKVEEVRGRDAGEPRAVAIHADLGDDLLRRTGRRQGLGGLRRPQARGEQNETAPGSAIQGRGHGQRRKIGSSNGLWQNDTSGRTTRHVRARHKSASP